MPAGQIDEPCPAGRPAVLLGFFIAALQSSGNDQNDQINETSATNNEGGCERPASAALSPKCGPNSHFEPPSPYTRSRARWARMPAASFFCTFLCLHSTVPVQLIFMIVLLLLLALL